jgi:hypothetical protein
MIAKQRCPGSGLPAAITQRTAAGPVGRCPVCRRTVLPSVRREITPHHKRTVNVKR